LLAVGQESRTHAIPSVLLPVERLMVPGREVSGPVRARNLAITYPSLTPEAAAEEAARLLAEEAVEGVFVHAEADGDDTLLTMAATLARTSAPLVVVRDQDGRLLGGITTSRLIRQLLGAQ
jgi:CBS domain-containing protein